MLFSYLYPSISTLTVSFSIKSQSIADLARYCIHNGDKTYDVMQNCWLIVLRAPSMYLLNICLSCKGWEFLVKNLWGTTALTLTTYRTPINALIALLKTNYVPIHKLRIVLEIYTYRREQNFTHLNSKALQWLAW